ncbi:GNAT family N-acetyltransferase [Streptomyces sp. NPDC000594]|uniref:GNAT family N-acetyltransferase n=1 Tax=Streptomyces sp. NPDC000594 TaxID=3154261 RepID=UPI00331E053E
MDTADLAPRLETDTATATETQTQTAATEIAETGALVLRDATAADAERLMEVIHLAYRRNTGRAWTSEAHLIEGMRITGPALRGLIGAPGRRLLAAVQDGAVVGCCSIERQGESAHFGLFAVDPARQAGGLGRRVLAEAERAAREAWDTREMRMTVLTAREELIAWYVRRGYRRTGELSPFPYDEPTVGVPVRADLAFELLVKDITAG